METQTSKNQECSNNRRELRARKEDSNGPIRQQEVHCKHASQCCVELPDSENLRWNKPQEAFGVFSRKRGCIRSARL